MKYWRVYLFFHLVFTEIIQNSFGGDGVLVGHELSDEDIKPEDIALLQYDTRPIRDYWAASFIWNKAYADLHGHQYFYFSMPSGKECRYLEMSLSPAWCKVRAMIAASEKFTHVKAFVYLDSDAVMTTNFSLAIAISYMKKDLRWNVQRKPIAFNQDGPGWACKRALELGFPHCFNSGTILWFNTEKAVGVLRQWWHSAGEPYSNSKFPQQWRTQWPWEQAQLHALYLRHSAHVMVLSFPDLPNLPWGSSKNPKSQYPTDTVEPWCFSHWPGANCFITHYCASQRQKMKILDLYDLWRYSPKNQIPITVFFL